MSDTTTQSTDSSGRHRRVLAGGIGVLAVSAAVLAVALSGGGSGPLDPAEALAQAAGDTSAVSSGVVRTSLKAPEGTMGSEVRFDGEDGIAVLDIDRADGPAERREIRVVDGRVYERTDDGAWTDRALAEGEGVASLREEIADEALVQRVRDAPDVRQQDGVYTAILRAGDLVGLQDAPLGLGVATPGEDVRVQVEAGDDGLLRSVAFSTGPSEHVITYSELGTSQEIAAP